MLSCYTTVQVANNVSMKRGNSWSLRKEERLTVCLLHRLHSFSTSRELPTKAVTAGRPHVMITESELPSPTEWEWNKVEDGWEVCWTTLPEATKACRELIQSGCKKGCRGHCNNVAVRRAAEDTATMWLQEGLQRTLQQCGCKKGCIGHCNNASAAA